VRCKSLCSRCGLNRSRPLFDCASALPDANRTRKAAKVFANVLHSLIIPRLFFDKLEAFR
jgi:hypothetical protein